MLNIAAEQLTKSLWDVASELNKTLRDLSKVEHFDSSDPASIGAALHGALPSVLNSAEVQKSGLSVRRCVKGPGNKIHAVIHLETCDRDAVIELHYAGPLGGTRKSRHQLASVDINDEPFFPNFGDVAPDSLLFFLSYSLNGTSTEIARLHLMYADGVDRSKVRLFELEEATSTTEELMPAAAIAGARLNVKTKALGEAHRNGREKHKRRDGTPST